MDSYRTEEEQVEALKRWWDENGRSTIVSVVLALGVVLGWQGWQKYRGEQAQNASFLYQQMISGLSDRDGTSADEVAELALQLKDGHAGSTYAQFAALYLAQLAMEDGDIAAAEEELRWVLAKGKGEIQSVAQLRLGKVLAQRGETQAALDMLAAGQGGKLAAAFAMARGDVLLAAGRDDEARLAYDAAVAGLDPSQPLPKSLEEKISFLNAQAPQAAASASRAATPEAG